MPQCRNNCEGSNSLWQCMNEWALQCSHCATYKWLQQLIATCRGVPTSQDVLVEFVSSKNVLMGLLPVSRHQLCYHSPQCCDAHGAKVATNKWMQQLIATIFTCRSVPTSLDVLVEFVSSKNSLMGLLPVSRHQLLQPVVLSLLTLNQGCSSSLWSPRWESHRQFDISLE